MDWLYIRDISDAPFFVSVPIEDASVASQYVYNIDLSHNDGNDVSLIAIAPHWLTLTEVSGADYQWDLSGTPGNNDVGLQEVVLVATDGIRSTTQKYSLKVANNNIITISCSNRIDISQNDKLDEILSFLYQDATLGNLESNLLDISYSKPDWVDITYNSLGFYEITGTPLHEDVGEHQIIITASHEYIGNEDNNNKCRQC